MKYLLDTDTLIDFIQDTGETRSRIVAMLDAGDEVGLCAVTVAELYSGLSEKNHARWKGSCQPCHIGMSHAVEQDKQGLTARWHPQRDDTPL